MFPSYIHRYTPCLDLNSLYGVTHCNTVDVKIEKWNYHFLAGVYDASFDRTFDWILEELTHFKSTYNNSCMGHPTTPKPVIFVGGCSGQVQLHLGTDGYETDDQISTSPCAHAHCRQYPTVH